MPVSKFGHSEIFVDDFCKESEILKEHWKLIEDKLDTVSKEELGAFYDRLDVATAGTYISEKCRAHKRDLLTIWDTLKIRMRRAAVVTLAGGEVITEEMLAEGYDAARDSNGTPPKGLVLGHIPNIYQAMRAVAPDTVKHVFIPDTADEAEAMLRTGYAWLKANAPERLLEEARNKPMPPKKDINAYAEQVQESRALTHDDQRLLDKALNASTEHLYDIDQLVSEPVRFTPEERDKIAKYLEDNPFALYDIAEPYPQTLRELKQGALRCAKQIIGLVEPSDEDTPSFAAETKAGMELILGIIRHRVHGDVSEKIETWSMRPPPDSDIGKAWAEGAKQGYNWALSEINYPIEQILKNKEA